MAFTSGTKKWTPGGNDHIIDLANGLDYLVPRNDGIALLKKIGMNGFTARAPKFEFTETSLATRSETVTVTDSATSLTVADAYQYQVNELIKIENEVVRVTAIAGATTLTIVRAYAGTTAAAHTSKEAYSLGSADPENSLAPAGVADAAARLYNYVQTFTRAVSLSNDEIASLSTEGNPLTGQLERRYIEIMQQFARAFFYGVRYEDTSNNIHSMGGLKQFVSTNVTNVSGAMTLSNIDAQILAIVLAGGDPKVIACSPTRKQKLDALDNNIQRLGKQEHVGGGLITQTWQSGVLDHTLDVIVDHTILDDELWILDTDNLEIGSLSGNGVSGAFHVENATTPGQDGESRVIRGKYTLKVSNEKAHGYLYGLS